MNAETKLKRRQMDLDQERFYAEQVHQYLKNPLVEFILGSLFIGYITRGSQSVFESKTGIDMAAGTMGAGMTSIILAQQLAPLMPKYEDIKSLLPGVLGLLK